MRATFPNALNGFSNAFNGRLKNSNSFPNASNNFQNCFNASLMGCKTFSHYTEKVFVYVFLEKVTNA